MPFIGIVPPTQRVQGLFGGATNVSAGSAPLNNIVDGTAQAVVGLVGWYKEPIFGRISVLAYAQAQASIAYGAALKHVAGDATTLSSSGGTVEGGMGVSQVQSAPTGSTTSGYAFQFAGVAAASVINTGHFFWRYISGYVPNAKCGSSLATGQAICVAPSTTGVLGKMNVTFNASNATSATAWVAVGFPLMTTDATEGSVASIFLTGWYI